MIVRKRSLRKMLIATGIVAAGIGLFSTFSLNLEAQPSTPPPTNCTCSSGTSNGNCNVIHTPGFPKTVTSPNGTCTIQDQWTYKFTCSTFGTKTGVCDNSGVCNDNKPCPPPQ